MVSTVAVPEVNGIGLVEPQSFEDADRLLAELGRIEAMVTQEENRLQSEISAYNERINSLRAESNVRMTPLRTRHENVAAALQAYAEAHRQRLLSGKGKTVRMPSGTIAWEMSRLKIEFVGSIKDVLAELSRRRLLRFTRSEPIPSKELMGKDLKAVRKLTTVKVIDPHDQIKITPHKVNLAINPPTSTQAAD